MINKWYFHGRANLHKRQIDIRSLKMSYGSSRTLSAD